MADRVLEVEGLSAWYMVKKTPFSPKEKKVVLHDLSFYIEKIKHLIWFRKRQLKSI